MGGEEGLDDREEEVDEICVSNTCAELYKVKCPHSYKFYPVDGLTRVSFFYVHSYLYGFASKA